MENGATRFEAASDFDDGKDEFSTQQYGNKLTKATNHGGQISTRSDSDYGSTLNLNASALTHRHPALQKTVSKDDGLSLKNLPWLPPNEVEFNEISNTNTEDRRNEPPPTSSSNEPKSFAQRARKNVRKRFIRSARSCCAREAWYGRIPILRWLPRYSRRDATGDLIAGITVGLTVVPQSLAYAAIAGLPLQYGLYSSFMGCFVYCILGTSKDVAMGTAALTSLLTASVITKLQPFSPQYAVCVCFLVGVLQLILGILRLGILIDFVSTPVLKGFINSGAIIIAAEQIKNLLGIKSRRGAFYITIYDACASIGHANIYDVIVSAISFVVLIGLKHLTWPLICRVFRIRMPVKSKTRIAPRTGTNKVGNSISAPSTLHRTNSVSKPLQPSRSLRMLKALRFTIRMISLCRNAFVVVVASVAAYLMLSSNINVITLSEKVPPGMPPFRPPPFVFPETNRTVIDLIETAGGGIGILAVLSLLITVSVGKALGARNGYYIDPTQEFLAVGLANIASSFVSSYPITTSFSRASLNSDSGVRTPASGVITGGLVILALSLLSPYFSYIPRSALAAVIVCAVLPLFETDVFMHMWRVNRLDLIPLAATMIGAFMLGSEYGIIIGVVVSLVLLLYANARPKIEIDKNVNLPPPPGSLVHKKFDDILVQKIASNTIIVCPFGSLYFPCADYIRDLLNDQHVPRLKKNSDHSSLQQQQQQQNCVIIDASHVTHCDYTSICALRDALATLRKRDVLVAFVALRLQLVKKLHASGIKTESFTVHNSLEEAQASISCLQEQQRHVSVVAGAPVKLSVITHNLASAASVEMWPNNNEPDAQSNSDEREEDVNYDRESVAEFVPTIASDDEPVYDDECPPSVVNTSVLHTESELRDFRKSLQVITHNDNIHAPSRASVFVIPMEDRR